MKLLQCRQHSSTLRSQPSFSLYFVPICFLIAAKELPLRSASVAMASVIIVLYGGWSIASFCVDVWNSDVRKMWKG